MWDVFRVSSDKLALCHLELMRKMNDLIREINKYGDEQVKIHRRVGARGRARRCPTQTHSTLNFFIIATLHKEQVWSYLAYIFFAA